MMAILNAICSFISYLSCEFYGFKVGQKRNKTQKKTHVSIMFNSWGLLIMNWIHV